jgi:threonine dehydrogenase-like Zn-dependent dehydrogenase
MKAVIWCGKHRVECANVEMPRIVNGRDAIIRVTSTAICGSDLHLYNGYIPSMQKGDVLGHEFMGEVIEVGPGINPERLRVGDRVVVPFNIACGSCFFCKHDLFACCDNTNPNAGLVESLYGYSPAGMFGYSHLFGGYAGGQAEYVRVPFADVGPFRIPPDLDDERVLFLTDIFPTGYMAAENCNIDAGDTVAVWGCGPVGQFAIRSAKLLGAERVIAIDQVPGRLRMAAEAGAETINSAETDVADELRARTANRGPDSCIDCVGLEAHGMAFDALLDRIKAATYLATDRAHALRQAIVACRKGGTVSVPGVYGGFIDKFPFGAAFGKGLTIRGGQTHVHRYLPRLLDHVRKGDLDPRFVITHRYPLSQAAEAYKRFRDEKDDVIKVVLKP